MRGAQQTSDEGRPYLHGAAYTRAVERLQRIDEARPPPREHHSDWKS